MKDLHLSLLIFFWVHATQTTAVIIDRCSASPVCEWCRERGGGKHIALIVLFDLKQFHMGSHKLSLSLSPLSLSLSSLFLSLSLSLSLSSLSSLSLSLSLLHTTLFPGAKGCAGWRWSSDAQLFASSQIDMFVFTQQSSEWKDLYLSEQI